MNFSLKLTIVSVAVAQTVCAGGKAINDGVDPPAVVAAWSTPKDYQKIIDINFSDAMWPGQTWGGKTGADSPELADGGYVNTIIDVPANGGSEVTYPVMFHNCTFANKKSYNGFAGATAAFSRQYYLGQSATGKGNRYANDWTAKGHTAYLEDNIKRDKDGNIVYGEAGFVQMCSAPATAGHDNATKGESQHGWVEIDHIPYVERVQWSWSSTSWGRGIKCDIKIGNGQWKPLVWMGSGMAAYGYSAFSDQGYMMENVINASDVSLRWRVWDGEDQDNPVQLTADGKAVFQAETDPLARQQPARVHKIMIYGKKITAEQALYARQNPVGSVGELTAIRGHKEPHISAPDAKAPVELKLVAQDGSAQYTSIQQAIDAVSNGARGIIYVRPGVYDENVYAGRRNDKNKFISIIGEDRNTTILTSSVDRGPKSKGKRYYDCAALNVYADRFYAENITIRNTSGNVGQAEALFTAGDAHVFSNCTLSGYQDTYKANGGARGYFSRCTIEGATDFIYDAGLEWFDNCEIRCVRGKGYITAAATSELPLTRAMYPKLSQSRLYAGLFFNRCRLTAEQGVADGAYYLGRPWKENCGTMFINCTLSSHINKAGWLDWGGRGNTASYLEYNSTDENGQPADTSRRVSFGRQATKDEVEAYINADFLFKKASDVPFDFNVILQGAPAPSVFTRSGNTFEWNSDRLAAGYLIYRNGRFEAFVAEPEYTISDGNADEYSVKTVSRQGATSEAVAMRVTPVAFPTAEGFGKYATGGRGGQVVTVTSLADTEDEGTLRWAFSQYPGEPLTIVFAVNGEIRLNSNLRVKRANWTLAGQTAPGDGISIVGDKVNFGSSENFIVRNIRFRAGDGKQDQACGTENCTNFIFDHCVFGWSMEENMNTADSHYLTVQYCIVHEGLNDAGHKKGKRGYGSQWGGSPATYHHNLLAGNDSRSPRFNGARGEDYVVFMEYVNNVNFNWGRWNSCYGGENSADITEYNGRNSAHECNFMNNYYKPGPESPANSVFVMASHARKGATSWGPARWYVSGNVMEGNDAATADNWQAMSAEKYTTDQIRVNERIVPEMPYYKLDETEGAIGKYRPSRYMLTDIQTAGEAYKTVLKKAGTINRDATEKRVINDVKSGNPKFSGSKTGKRGIIDSVNDAEGFGLSHKQEAAPADTDGDGMPDKWEKKHGLNPDNADDRNLTNPDGYTALEVYLNSLMGEKLSCKFSSTATSYGKQAK